MTDAPHLFEVRDLTVDFRRTGHPAVRAVDGISYHLDAGETLVLLGESGSGKSVSSMAAMGLLDPPPAATVGGSVTLGGTELLTLDRDGWSQVRGPRIAMVFQDALSALNPCLSVGIPDLRDAARPPSDEPQTGQGRRGRPDGPDADPGRRPTGRRLPAPVLRRDAAADHDRHGDRRRAGDPDRRRADHRAGRHGAGADHGPARRSPRRAADGPAVDHPRPGRRGRCRRPDGSDVPRPDRRGGERASRLRRRRPPVHPRAARLGAAVRSRPVAGPADSRDSPGRRGGHSRLRVSSEMPTGAGHLPHRPAPALAARPGPGVDKRLPFRGRGGRSGRDGWAVWDV